MITSEEEEISIARMPDPCDVVEPNAKPPPLELELEPKLIPELEEDDEPPNISESHRREEQERSVPKPKPKPPCDCP